MAGSAAQVKVKKEKKETITIREPCEGSGIQIKGEKGRKQVGSYYNYSYKYPCPKCGGLYAKTKDGKINRHTKKTIKEKPFTLCAECCAEVFTVDFLCEQCRAGEGGNG